MKVGDLVKVKANIGDYTLIGTIVSQWRVGGWWEVLIKSDYDTNGRVIHWPESQMELVND